MSGQFLDDTPLSLVVNGQPRTVEEVATATSLLDVLRDSLGLRGTKNACLQGRCGSCSVLLDGRLVAACLVPACDADGGEVVTVEGLTGGAPPGDAGPGSAPTAHEVGDIAAALLDNGAVQCGFCTPGMVVAVHALLRDRPGAAPLEIAEELSGNLCRCTGYGRILAAVEQVRGAEASPAVPGPAGATEGATDG